MWWEFSFVSQINQTFEGLQFSALWLCFVQGYCWAKTSQRDLMRPNAAVPSFTLVPSRPKWKQAWHPGHFWGSYAICEDRTNVWCGLVEYTVFLPTFEQTSNRITTAAMESVASSSQLKTSLDFFFLLNCWTTLWCKSSEASEAKHLKPMSNTSNSSLHVDSLCCWTSVHSPTLLSGRNECVPPRLAERRTRDIFRMTRGAHALKWMTYFISNDRSASFLAHLLLAAPSSLCSAAA